MTDRVAIRRLSTGVPDSTRSWAGACRNSPSMSSPALQARGTRRSRSRSCSPAPVPAVPRRSGSVATGMDEHPEVAVEGTGVVRLRSSSSSASFREPHSIQTFQSFPSMATVSSSCASVSDQKDKSSVGNFFSAARSRDNVTGGPTFRSAPDSQLTMASVSFKD